jgi:FMN phosphatase YigB (HAD superfamily)
MIKAVIFDLGRVIVPFDFRRGYDALEPLCGISASEIPKRIAATGLVPRFERGEIEPRDFVREFSRELGVELPYSQFCTIWCSIFSLEPLIPEEMLAAIRQNYRLILLSNTNAIHFKMIREAFPLLRQFHALVLSYEVGAMKPSPLIYERAIEEAGCRAEECFFTDDIPEYVEGARRAGIDAVQFQSAEQIREELTNRGVILG